MISYDSYQNRIKRIAAIKNFIVRFRLLFIALAVLIVATIFTLLGITGIVTKDIVLPSNPVYGDAFTVEKPKALMSNAEYQFRYLGKSQSAEAGRKTSVRTALTADGQSGEGEWTYETPALAGRYEVRVVTKSGFGGKKYGTPKQFEIESKPVEFIINADSLTYGAAPDSGSYEFNLVNGDRLLVEGLTFSYEDPSLDITNICANSDSFVILNTKGQDVTFCYNITTPQKEVSLEQKSISLSLDDVTFEYCGTPIEYTPALSQSTLSALKGDNINFETVITDVNGTVVEAPVNAGTYTVTIQPEISFFNGTADVSKHYNIKKSSTATFTVLPRKVTVTTHSVNKEYDGTPLVSDGFDVDDGLIKDKGHNLVLLSSTLDKCDAGEYENRSSFAISDGDGNDLTANYEITYNFGLLQISKRAITVKTADHTKVYDGQVLSEQDFNDYTLIKDGAEALANNHTQALWLDNAIIDVGTTSNEISINIFDEIGNIVTENYDITYETGTLTILKREITITTPTDSWVYDGYDHENSEITVKLTDGSDGNPFADGEEYVILQGTSVTYFSEEPVTNTVICTVFSHAVRDTFTSDVGANYEITYEYGTLSITKRPVTITTPTNSKVYDGYVLRGSDGEILADNLADTDIISSDYRHTSDLVSFRNVGKETNTTKFRIYDLSVNWYFDDEAERTENYEITYIYGELEITKRDITIHTSSPEKIYDGEPLYGDSVEPLIDNLELYYAEAYNIAECTSVGTTENTTQYKFFEIYLPETDLVDITDNFDITYDYGTIIVNKRPVSIITATSSKEYDGEAYSDTEGFTAFNVVEGHTVELNPDFAYSTVTDYDEGKVDNKVEYLIFSGEDDLTENYDIDYTYGKISRTKRIVQITTASDSWTYDGQSHGNATVVSTLHGSMQLAIDEDERIVVPKVEVSDVEIPDYFYEFVADDKAPFVLDHKLRERSSTTITNVGTAKNNCQYDVVDKNGVSVGGNYDLKMEYGELEITRRPIIITTASKHHTYDDTAFSYTEGWKVDGGVADGKQLEKGLVNDHILIVRLNQNGEEIKTYITDVARNENGEIIGVENKVEYEVYDGTDIVSGNYEIIEYRYGTLTVDPRPITIQTPTSSKEFDGEPYSDADTNPEQVITVGSLVDGHFLFVVAKVSVTYVTEGAIDNEVTYKIVRADLYNEDGNEGEIVDLTANYDVTYAPYGKISRTKRFVYVLTATNDWTYDGDEHFDDSYDDRHVVNGLPSEENGLVLEHKLKALTYATVKDYAEFVTPNICTYTVKTKDGEEDVSGNYILAVEFGEISILKRPIIITTPTKEHFYDGDSFSWTEGWSVEGGVAKEGKLEKGLAKEEHTLKVKLDEEGKEIKTYITDVLFEGNDITGVPNIVEYEVYDGETSVDHNYEIVDYIYGTLTVNQRLISVKTDSASKVYDGTPLYCDEFTYNKYGDSKYSDGDIVGYDGLLTNKNHTITLDEDQPLEFLRYLHVDEDGKRGDVKKVDLTEEISVAYITYITTIDGKLINSVFNMRSYKILNENGKDISYNYRFMMSYGVLTILERPLTITTPTMSKPYDGAYLSGTAGTTIFDNLAETDDAGNKEYSEAVSVAKVIDHSQGAVTNDTRYSIYTNSDKTINTTLCYDITYVDGELSIDQINLTITRITPIKVYDGEVLKGDDESYTSIFAGIIAGEGYESFNVTELTDAGQVPNETQYTIYTYRDGVKTDTTENYIITYTPDRYITITKRVITVQTATKSHEYDGTEFTYPQEWSIVSEDGLITKYNHTLKADEIKGRITDVLYDEHDEIIGVPNEVSYIVVVDGNDEIDVNKNYTIEYATYGTLTVTQRIIKIITVVDKWTYDAEEHSNDEASCLHLTGGNPDGTKGLVLDHELETLSFAKITDVGFTSNECTYKIVSKTAGDVTKNYLFDENTYSYGTLTITKRSVTIKTATDSHEYDGSAFYKTDGFKVEEFNLEAKTGIVSGHTAYVDETAGFKTVTYVHEGEVDNVLEFLIKDGNGNPVTKNYEIKVEYGKLSITPHTITVTNPTLTKVYDGTPLYGYDEEHKPEVTGLIDGDKLIADVIAEITDVGSISNSTTYMITTADGTAVIYDGDGAVKDSYIINYTPSTTLSITNVGLRITTASFEKVYDGTPLYGDKSKNGDEATEISSFVIKHYDVKTNSWVEGLIEGNYAFDEADLKSLTDVNTDTVDNTTKYRIYADRNGKMEDITANYGEIDYTWGTLTVIARPIKIKTPTVSKEFTGKPITDSAATVISGHPLHNYTLVEGHKLVVKDGFEIPSVTFVTDGEVENIIDFDIVDEYNNYVNGNYDVTEYIYGKLSLTQRQISITTATNTNKLEYNGKPQGDDLYTEKYLGSGSGEAFADGHTLEIIKEFRITNVSENSENNNVFEYVIIDSEGTDRTENYAITDIYGTVKINPRPIDIALNKVNDFTYGDVFGGYPLVDGQMFTYVEGSAQTVTDEELDIKEVLEIEIAYQLGGEFVVPVNAGNYEVVVTSKKIVGGNADINNYSVSVASSFFTIYPKKISINLLEVADGGKTYDATEFMFPLTLGYGYEIASGELVEGDTLTIAVEYLQNGRFVDNVLYNIAEKYVSGNPVNAGAYIVQFDSENCTLDNDKPVSNYQITCITNRQSFEIRQRKIYFSLSEITLVYTSLDEYKIPDEDAMPDFNDELLAVGDTLTDVRSGVANLDGSPIKELKVGVYESSVYSFVVKRGDDTVTSNYYLDNSDSTKNRAKFEIVKRQIQLSVWFENENDGEGASASSGEYTGEKIDLNKLSTVPYKSEVINDTYNPDFGIGANDIGKVEAVFSFTQDGKPVTLLERGEYVVDVTLVDKEGSDVLEKNYEIVYPSIKGEFTVTRRQVIVTPKTTQKNIEYDGNAINQDFFDYDTLHKLEPYDVGFVTEEDKNDYNKVYHLYKLGDDTTDHINDILWVGTYKLSVELEYKGEGEEKYDIEYRYSAEFTVLPRTIYVKTYDDEGDYVYDKTVHGDTQTYSFVPYFLKDGALTTENVFCNDDSASVLPVYEFFHEKNYTYSQAVFAGKYTIKVTSFTDADPESDIGICENYQVVDFPAGKMDNPYGTLSIRPAKVLVLPLPYSKEYDGNNVLYMPEDNYSIKYVEGRENVEDNDKLLLGEDRLSVTFNTGAKIGVGSAIVKISNVKVVYPESEDVDKGIENYLIVYAFNQLKSGIPELANDYSLDNFRTELSFKQITLRIAQPKPNVDKQVEYGSSIKIRVSDSKYFADYVLDDCDGYDLFINNGHRISITVTYVKTDKLGLIKNWLDVGSIKITDSSNTTITRAYKIEIVYDDEAYADTYIEVVPIDIEVKVYFNPSAIADGSTLSTGAYIIEKGSFLYGDVMTVKVAGGKFVADIKDLRENDRNEYYSVIFTYPETENIIEEEAYAPRI